MTRTTAESYRATIECLGTKKATWSDKQIPNPLTAWEESHMKFRPLHDRVVVRRIDAEEKSAGGIIIPDTAKEKPSQGEVIAAGPGRP